jgi:hypothetical protein
MTCNDVRDLLPTLNKHNNYDILNPLLLAFGDSNDTNPYIENKLNTLYYDQYLPRTPLISPNNISFFSLNIRSLMSNNLHLNPIISNFRTIGSNVKAIALQEIWSVPYPELIHIDGFTFICKTRKNGRGGALASTYVKT